LVFANVLGAQTVWKTLEASREILHYPDVTAYGSVSVIATLEFLQHHFSEMSLWDLLVTQTYLNQQATTALFALRVASAAERLRSSRIRGSWRNRGDRARPLGWFVAKPYKCRTSAG
jgi:hypothetical protein